MADLRASTHRWVALLTLITRAPVLGESSPVNSVKKKLLMEKKHLLWMCLPN